MNLLTLKRNVPPMLQRCAILLFIISLSLPVFAQSGIYEVANGSISFHSDAPHELIYASSDKLRGILDMQKKVFVFKINISSFTGFNSPLQREHFNENYMETTFYPEATFTGKIIEDADLGRDGDYIIRAKGKLKIHGIEQERIIKVHVISKNKKITATSDFVVLLADYDIKIPRIVSDKLSPNINVLVNCVLTPKM